MEGLYDLPSRVIFFDTTLRDGEQTPGVALRVEEKVKIAEALSELGVDVIEAGFAIVSKGEYESVKRISGLGLDSKVCSLSRCDRRDIDVAVDAGCDWVHVFIATSELHMRHKLNMTREEVVERAVEMVEYAKERGVVVHFSAEDATRSDMGFLMHVFKSVRDAGADSIDIPDTVGVALPHVMRALAKRAKEVTGLPVAVHCHDDMGLATANTLAGVEGGAEIVHVTMNGIGERAGNTSLEEVAVALKFLYGVETGIKYEEIAKVSKLVARLTGIPVPKNKAIIGENAFSHESGIHVHGVIRHPATYEPIMPEQVGMSRRIVIGKHSGLHSIDTVLRQYGFVLGEGEVRAVLERVKAVADLGRKLSDQELLQIVNELVGSKAVRPVVLTGFQQITTESGDRCIVEFEINGETLRVEGVGNTPLESAVDASLKAFTNILGDIKIIDYSLFASPYEDRHPYEAEVIIKVDGNTITGKGIGKTSGHTILNAVSSAVNQYLLTSSRRVGK
ncbi:MAG: 2-isopropylmalate synthase [Nitrososphaerota archaeon]|nr:2-isopropylmalate synthase [Candidatus Calditenuaceae archaeon]MDW8073320.1 2-isopropylmalate synthase [Nitrososphaerota archaeon]